MASSTISVDFSLTGGLCACQPSKCVNFNPCEQLATNKIHVSEVVAAGTVPIPLRVPYFSYVSYSVDKEKDMVVFAEEPGPGRADCLRTAVFCAAPGIGCLCLICAFMCWSPTPKSMGVICSLKNGKVKCQIRDKICFSEHDVVTLENVCDIRVMVMKKEERYDGAGSTHASRLHPETVFVFHQFHLVYNITYMGPDGMINCYQTRPFKNPVIVVDIIKEKFEPFVLAVRELISRSDSRVRDANCVPDIFKPTNYITEASR